MKVLILDNYDSFTYNLVQLVHTINGQAPDVFRNDEISLEEVDNYDKILLSPGPGVPSEAGILIPLIKKYAATKSIFGVCLGQQAIGEAFGATLTNLSNVYHGVATPIELHLEKEPYFNGISQSINVGRYHSWVVDKEKFPKDLQITATDENGFIMGLRHKMYDVSGVQFHPESILTPDGPQIIQNWLLKK